MNDEQVRIAAIQAAIIIDCLRENTADIRRPTDTGVQDRIIRNAVSMIPTIDRFLKQVQ